jgi:hypothetical protein
MGMKDASPVGFTVGCEDLTEGVLKIPVFLDAMLYVARVVVDI